MDEDNNEYVQQEPAQQEPSQHDLSQQEPSNPYQTIIEQQQAQINALIEQTTALNNQIINMVNSGAQFNDGKQVESKPIQQPVSLSDDKDYSLESLAKEIGRKNG